MQYGDILKDQSGQVMGQGENVAFLVLGPSDSQDFTIMEISDKPGEPMGNPLPVSKFALEKMKYVGSLQKMVWEEL